MKAGLLTFHEADNYGAVLQAFALQQTLKKLDVESEFITVLPEKSSKHPVHETSHPAAGSLYLKRIEEAGRKRANLFDSFRKEYLVCSDAYSNDRLEELNGIYDFFLAGSDQIWNIRIPDADPRFFLPFANSDKCFSYAASFGAEEIPASVKDWCAAQLSRFSLLSVREGSGRKLIRDLIQKDAFVCLDPTLLMDRSEWESLTTPIPGPPYYLLFALKYDPTLVQKARMAAEQAGVELKVITAAFMPQFGFSCWNGIGVNDWLSLFAGTEGVFTNSFHGTAFSLLFDKPLCVVPLGGELGKRNGRIEELLNMVGNSKALEGALAGLPSGVAAETLLKGKMDSIHFLERVISLVQPF